MLPFNTFIPVDRKLDLPVYQQIANGIIQHIRNGLLLPGSKLPGSRELSRILKVHRKTVIASYDELVNQGWILSLYRKGFMISMVLPLINPKKWDQEPNFYPKKMASPYYSLSKPNDSVSWNQSRLPAVIIDDGYPDTRLAPMDLLMREYRSRLKIPNALKSIPGTVSAGSEKLREAMINFLGETRGLHTHLAGLLITHGAQMSIYLAARILLRPGDVVLVAEPGYNLANQVFQNLGAVIIRIEADDLGMDVNKAEIACKAHKVQMIYLIPHHHHPTTVTLSPERRMRLLELAQEFNFTIVEDDYDYDFHYNSFPYLPLASSKHQNRVVYIGSFSKSIANSIRIGFMVAPEDFIFEAIYVKRTFDLNGDYILEDSLANLIQNGDISRHIKKANKIYQERRDYLCELLSANFKEKISFSKPSGGLAIWAQVEKKYFLHTISQKAAKKGLFISNGSQYNSPLTNYNALRLGFASLNMLEINQVIEILTESFK